MKNSIKLAVLGLFALLLASCGGAAIKGGSTTPVAKTPAGTPQRLQTGPMKIAILVPMTGEVGPVGQQLVNAAAVALFEKPELKAELLPFDTKGTPAGAAQAAAEARVANVDMVLGPLFGSHVAVVRQGLAGSSVTMLAFTNDTQQANENTFVLGLSVSAQVERAITFLASQDKNRLILIGPEGPYTERAIIAAEAATAGLGVSLLRVGTYPEDADFNAISNKVKEVTDYNGRRAVWAAYERQLTLRVRSAANPAALLQGEAARFGEGSVRGRMLNGMAKVYRSFAGSGRNRALAETVQRIQGVAAIPVDDYDAILLPVGDDNLVAIGSMLDLFNAGRGFAQLTGTNIWQNVDLSSEPSLLGGWFTQTNEASLSPFMLAYQNNFHERPEPIAVLGYHGARVALEAAASGALPVTPEFVRKADGFNGLAGTVRFGSDSVMRHPLSIYQVNPEGAQELQGSDPGS